MKKVVIKSILMLAAIALASLVVMLLWNAIAPAVMGWGVLSYLQAVGVFILSRLLFGRLGGPLNRGAMGSWGREMHSMSREQKREYIKEYMAATDKDVK